MQTRSRFQLTSKADGPRSTRLRSVVLVAAALIAAATVLASTPLAQASPVGRHGEIVFDDSGRSCDGAARLYTIDPNGDDRRELASGVDGSFSPDGRQIAFDSCGGGSIYGAISEVAAGGGEPHLLISGDHSYSSPSFSPDGRSLVFLRYEEPEGREDIWMARADGSHLRRVTSTPHASELAPSFTPDGKLIVFSSAGDTDASKRHLFTVRPDGRGLRELGPGTQPSISPNGKLIVYVRHGGIWVMRLDGTGAHVVKPGGGPPGTPPTDLFRDTHPVFSPDGRLILFDRETELREQGPLDRHVFLWTMHLDGTHIRKLPVEYETAPDESSPDWQSLRR
jgi:Tol biopolymer transport system component